MRDAQREQKHILRRLAELEERVQALEGAGGGSRPASSPDDADGPSAHVRELLSVGRKIEAIKAYQEETGPGSRRPSGASSPSRSDPGLVPLRSIA